MFKRIGEAAATLGVSSETLRRWDKSGRLKPTYISDAGTRFYSDELLRTFMNAGCTEKVVAYCRVDGDNIALNQQVEQVEFFMLARGYTYEVIRDLGLSSDIKRDGLVRLVRMIAEHKVSKVVLASRETLLPVGVSFGLFECFCSQLGVEVIVIDSTKKELKEG